MADTWVYIIWTLVSVLLLAIVIALVLVCLRNHRFSSIRTKFVNILSMKNYEEDDLYQYEGEVFRRRMNDLNRSTEDNLEQGSSTENIFEGSDHIPIPRAGQIKIQDSAKTAIAEEGLHNVERRVSLKLKQKSPPGSSVIHNPSAGVRPKHDKHTSSLSGLSKGGAVVLRANEVGTQLSADFSPAHYRFPRARLVNFIGKHGSAQITVSQDNHTPKPKKRTLPMIDPVDNKPIKLRKNSAEDTREEIPRPEETNFTLSSSPGNELEEKEGTPSKTQTQYDRRGRPVKPQTRKPSQIIVHEEIAPGIVIINKKRASKKNSTGSRRGSSRRKETNEKPSHEQQQHVLHEQFILQRNEGINRKNKPSPLNLALPNSIVQDFAFQIHEQRNIQQRDNETEIVAESDLHSDFESIEYGEEFSPEIQWKLKGQSNVYELVQT